jgi:5-methylcytosine-specific restriction endonuclease McrA
VDNHGNRKSNPKIVTYKTIISQYHNSCRRKGTRWELTEEEAISLFNSHCFYCGTPPKQSRNAYIKKHRSTKTWHQEATVYFNGIDRLDSGGHYTASNTVASCFVCNRAKGNMSLEDFRQWINRIARHIIDPLGEKT